MPDWHKLIHQTETQFDRAFSQTGEDDPLLIQSYLGYGVPGRAFVLGRVLEDRGVAEAEKGDSLWQNFKGAWKRFRSGEVAHAELLEAKAPDEGQRARATQVVSAALQAMCLAREIRTSMSEPE